MAEIATTRMSSKGQVVIPDKVRRRMRLRPGARFVVVAEGDMVILKTVRPPSMKDFEGLIRQARRKAQEAGMKRSEVGKVSS